MEQRAFIPKARLIQILGEHLIKDATVGLLELVKNSYDADATVVTISMIGINTSSARIEIRDNGYGMDLESFMTKWMNPAAGHKLVQKNRGERSPLGRLPLGEKGVGRFATQQIGKYLEMVSKTAGMAEELVVLVDWSHFDDPETNLSEANVQYSTRPLLSFRPDESGLHLKIDGLKAIWSEEEVEKLSNPLRRMKSPFKGANNFDVKLIFEDCPQEFKKYENLELSDILERAHYKFFGVVDEKGVLEFEYDFQIPGFEKSHKEDKISLVETRGNVQAADTICGGFMVNVHVYDKTRRFLKISDVNPLDLKELSGISIYRDGLRILPYGEPGNDWLNLGYRRIQDPGHTVSNDQIIGMVEIDQSENPWLKDKTNREGLIENPAYIGFARIVMAVIETLEDEMLDDRQKIKPRKEDDPQEEIERAFTEIKAVLTTVSDKANDSTDDNANQIASSLVATVERGVDDLRQSIGSQVEVFQLERNTLLNLAGTGLAAERFTHEFARLVNGANSALERLVRLIISTVDSNPRVKREIDTIRGVLDALRNDIRLLGPMFYIKKAAREKELDVKEMIYNTISLQRTALEKKNINTEIVGDSFVITMREGSCMQVINNLIDNSIYWLAKKSEDDKRNIRIILDREHRAVYLSDSGPGVVPRYKDKIFQPFFSMKGEDGRGLGLYIVKEILQEKSGDIFLVDKDEYPGLLGGATFKIFFGEVLARD